MPWEAPPMVASAAGRWDSGGVAVGATIARPEDRWDGGAGGASAIVLRRI
jgi:hypothetical protein